LHHPALQRNQDRIVAFILASGRGVQGRFCRNNLVGDRS
jgi:hypothetical protein